MSELPVDSEEVQKPTPTIEAQSLYDLRDLTGFISGADLHNVFRDSVGDPSPSGHEDIDKEKLSGVMYDEETSVVDALNKPLEEFLPGIIDYALEPKDKEAFGKELGKKFKDRLNNPIVEVVAELRKTIEDHYKPQEDQ